MSNMSSTTTTPAAPTTKKAQRKAAAATANDCKVFQETRFGRARIRSFPVQVARGIIMLVGVPVASAYRSIRECAVNWSHGSSLKSHADGTHSGYTVAQGRS
jgi:hypothetical protein